MNVDSLGQFLQFPGLARNFRGVVSRSVPSSSRDPSVPSVGEELPWRCTGESEITARTRMSTSALHALFYPKQVAIYAEAGGKDTYGWRLVETLLRHNYSGQIWRMTSRPTSV